MLRLIFVRMVELQHQQPKALIFCFSEQVIQLLLSLFFVGNLDLFASKNWWQFQDTPLCVFEKIDLAISLPFNGWHRPTVGFCSLVA